MTDQIQNKTITIQGFEFKNNRYKLTDQDNQSYGFFTTKKDGTDTQVFAQWKNMELGQGKSTEIGFVTEEFYSTKANKNIRTKKIISFREPSQQSAEVPKQVQDAYGHRLAMQGHVNAYLHSHSIEETINTLPDLLKLEDEINKALNGDMVQEISTEIIDVMKDIDEPPINDEDIPF